MPNSAACSVPRSMGLAVVSSAASAGVATAAPMAPVRNERRSTGVTPENTGTHPVPLNIHAGILVPFWHKSRENLEIRPVAGLVSEPPVEVADEMFRRFRDHRPGREDRCDAGIVEGVEVLLRHDPADHHH